MKSQKKSAARICGFVLPMACAAMLHAGATGDPTPASQASTRYGIFGLLDHRSEYGASTFPEPLLIDDTNLELNEFRIDWFHADIQAQRNDSVKVELEKGFGLLTLELELNYERESSPGETLKGLGSVNLGARHPIFQYVTQDGEFDTTFGVAVEVGIPTNTVMSKSTELVPKIFNDTRIGKHITVQSILGYSALYGGEDDGIHTLEYGLTLGYAFTRQEIAIPGVQQITPVFELQGEKQLNKEDSGRSTVLGNAALRVNLSSIGPIQPRLGVGYVFPMNSAAREDLHWGIYTSLVFEY